MADLSLVIILAALVGLDLVVARHYTRRLTVNVRDAEDAARRASHRAADAFSELTMLRSELEELHADVRGALERLPKTRSRKAQSEVAP